MTGGGGGVGVGGGGGRVLYHSHTEVKKKKRVKYTSTTTAFCSKKPSRFWLYFQTDTFESPLPPGVSLFRVPVISYEYDMFTRVVWAPDSPRV